MKNKLTFLPSLFVLLMAILIGKNVSSQVFCTISAVQHECCNGGNNGSISVTTTGGTLPYTYLWTPSGETNATATGLTVGTYTILVTDANGNTTTCTATITQPTLLFATPMGSTGNTACINPVGTATVMATGGTFPYTYKWEPTGQTNATATGLASGMYTCEVTDNNCCLSTVSVTVTGVAAPMVTLKTTPDTNSCDGTITAIIRGGTAPYTYKWSPGGQTTSSINSLCSGTYCCKVIDNRGCQDSICITVLTHDVIVSCACSNYITTTLQDVNSTGLNVDVYPNPTNNILNVSVKGLSSGAIFYLTDMLGRRITSSSHSVNSNNYKGSINIENLNPGMYYLIIETDKQRLVKKVTKL